MTVVADDTARSFSTRRRNISPAGSGRGPLPIVVGVTGHRDLRDEDVPHLEDRVRSVFERLLADHPHTPLMVLSPLAAGADRLVARVALEYGIPVVAPLPLEVDEYVRDFSEPETEEFHALLARMHRAFFVGYAAASDGLPAADAANVGDRTKRFRARQYARVGAYVARNCQVLIALWDGLPSSAMGGTAQVVEFKLQGWAEGFGPRQHPLDRPEFATVYHVVTPRAMGRCAPHAEPFALVRLDQTQPNAPYREEEPEYADVTRRVYERIDAFNADSLRAGAPAGAALTSEAIARAARDLARNAQTWTRRSLVSLYLAGLFGTLFFVAYAHVVHRWGWLAASVAVTLGGLATYWRALRLGIQDKHQDYRAIAEGLRVQEQWMAATLRDTVADYYLRQHRGELDWIRNAIRAAHVLDDTTAADEQASLAERRARLAHACAAWISDPKTGQIAYFARRSEENEARERRYVSAGWFAVLLSTAASLATLAAFGPFGGTGAACDGASWCIGDENGWWVALVCTIAVAAVVSGLAASYAEKRAFGAESKRYRRMRSYFVQARERLAEILGPDDEIATFTEGRYAEAQQLVRDLGQEALLESASWVLLHRERPLEFVQGG